MIEAPQSLTGMPFSDAVPGPAGLDVLSDALRTVRSSGALLLRGEFSAPWALDLPEAAVVAPMIEPPGTSIVIMHLIAQGGCWVELAGGKRVTLATGDIVLLPRGERHAMGEGEATATPVAALMPPPPWIDLPVLRHGGGGEPTQIVCCYLRCDDLLFNPVLDNLPAMLHVHADAGAAVDWFQASVRYIIAEAAHAGPGTSCLVSRLTELLFIEVLRRHMLQMASDEVGWFAALRDRYVARALQAFHSEAARHWTVEQLARHVGLSRSALMTRFNRLVGQSPMQYLTLWRLQLAAHRLAAGDDGLADVAAAVGYGSEEAFSRAFKRATGLSPAAWRSGRGGPPATGNGQIGSRR